MTIATFLLVVVTWKLAQITKMNFEFVKQQAEYKMDMVLIAPNINGKKFVGFTLTNIGKSPVIITHTHIALGVPESESNISAIYVCPKWETMYQEKEMSNFDPPHCLISGDFIKIAYDLEEIREITTFSPRLRYECKDSFGNTYVSRWVNYFEEPNSLKTYSTPGEGFIQSKEPKNPIEL